MLLATVSVARAQQPTDFFRNKQITLYIGYAVGGGYDIYCRLLAQHLGKHLPGNPAVVPKNEPGAGSIKLANELFNSFPKDGTALGMIGEALVISQVLGDPSAKFRASDFTWIGRISNSDPVLVTRPASGVATIQDAMNKEASIGIPGAGSATGMVLAVVNKLLGTKFKLVSGYEGSGQIRLAVERGEMDGAASVLWRFDRNWIRANKLNVVYRTSPEAAPDLVGVPALSELGRNEDERRLLTFFTSYTTIGRSIIGPPGIPQDRVDILRAGFDATMQDPAFIEDAKRANIDLATLPGQRLAELVGKAADLDANLLARARDLNPAAAETK
jgi:tripartite-type tricarboxylate transporter receptor subunit TctC